MLDAAARDGQAALHVAQLATQLISTSRTDIAVRLSVTRSAGSQHAPCGAAARRRLTVPIPDVGPKIRIPDGGDCLSCAAGYGDSRDHKNASKEPPI